jgi:hypothetical protein
MVIKPVTSMMRLSSPSSSGRASRIGPDSHDEIREVLLLLTIQRVRNRELEALARRRVGTLS